VGCRHHVGDLGRADLGLGPNESLGHRRDRDQERGRDLGGAQTTQRVQAQRDLGLAMQRGVAAGEDQAQAIIDRDGDRDHLSKTMIGLTSIVPPREPGHLAAHSIAASRFEASIR
jgi:hypothetical protein